MKTAETAGAELRLSAFIPVGEKGLKTSLIDIFAEKHTSEIVVDDNERVRQLRIPGVI